MDRRQQSRRHTREARAEESIEELARALPDVDWERPGFPQPAVGFHPRRRVFGL
jgi:hypothetical protein